MAKQRKRPKGEEDIAEKLRKGRKNFRGKMSSRVIMNKKDKSKTRRAEKEIPRDAYLDYITERWLSEKND